MLTFECANKVLYRSFMVIHSSPPRNGTALPEEQLGQHEILRVPSGLRTHPQDDIVFHEGGCAPFTPALRVRTQSLSGKSHNNHIKNKNIFPKPLAI